MPTQELDGDEKVDIDVRELFPAGLALEARQYLTCSRLLSYVSHVVSGPRDPASPQASRLEFPADLRDAVHLGDGGSADVYRAKYRLAGMKVHTDVALKVFKYAGALPKSLLDGMLAEVRLGASVRHANCVTLLGVVSLPRHGPAIVRAPGTEAHQTRVFSFEPSGGVLR